MIINRPGATFEYESVVYTIGETIVGTAESEYDGLFGSITEIRDGDDRETENETPDFYCTFEPPVLPHEIKELEATFSDLYDSPKTLDDICLDEVIMAPSMVEPISHINGNRRRVPIFVVREDWSVKGECGNQTFFFTDYQDARRKFRELLMEETENGSISDWSGSDKLQIETGKEFYECWINDEYFENHYKISINEDTLTMSDKTFGQIGRQHSDEVYREDVAAQVESWDDYVALTEKQQKDFIGMPGLPERIHKALGRNDCFWECYWETVSEVSHAALREYIKNEGEK